MQKVFFNGWGSKEHLWQKQNWIFHIIPEDKAPQPDSPGTSISCSASHTSLPVSGELQSYNMFCQGYIKKSELFTCILFSWPPRTADEVADWPKFTSSGQLRRQWGEFLAYKWQSVGALLWPPPHWEETWGWTSLPRRQGVGVVVCQQDWPGAGRKLGKWPRRRSWIGRGVTLTPPWTATTTLWSPGRRRRRSQSEPMSGNCQRLNKCIQLSLPDFKDCGRLLFTFSHTKTTL